MRYVPSLLSIWFSKRWMLIPFMAVLSLIVGMSLPTFCVYAATLAEVHPTMEVDLSMVGSAKSIGIDPNPATNPTGQLGCYAIPSSADGATSITLSTKDLKISQGSNLQVSVFASANCSGNVNAEGSITHVNNGTYMCSGSSANSFDCSLTIPPIIVVSGLSSIGGNPKSIGIDPGSAGIDPSFATKPIGQISCNPIPSSNNSVIFTNLAVSQGSNLQVSVFTDANCLGKVVANSPINNISITTYGCSINSKNILSCKATSPVSTRLLSSKNNVSSTIQKSKSQKSKPSPTPPK